MSKSKTIRLNVREVPGMGRGVFAGEPIKKGQVIETCPVIPLPKEDVKKLTDTVLDKYLFAWGEDLDDCCVTLGLGSLYNHSSTPNAVACRVVSRNEMEFIALRDISTGEQILTDYEWEEHEYNFPRDGTP